ncbi:DMT family transporter [Vibrio genomosp. F10]|uniref:EamA domain-containing protein n=1 Tax=Vibrio genomosp. F10 TaxID=723171 RepID=A0A1B9QWY4_9VIBR|nr:DMT family transporter [Vibrio genomosp. F10]OCH74351.1 hypothetical protein A6E14_12995 [Vibrio genomosp. F10]
MNKGVLLAIASALVFSAMNALVKAASLTIPSAEIVFFRSIIGTCLVLFLMFQARVTFSNQGVPLLVLRGVFGALYLLAFVYTIAHIPLADAAILAYLSPFFVIVLSNLVLGERLPTKAKLLLPMILVGVALVIDPFGFSAFNIYALAGIASAIFAAGASITIKQLSKNHHTYEIIFYFLATATVISAVLMKDTFVMPQGITWLYLVAIGVVSLLGQIFLTKAFTHENTGVVAVTRYIGLAFNILWGVIFWNEIPDWLTALGGTVIVISCVLLSWPSKDRKQTNKVAQPENAA